MHHWIFRSRLGKPRHAARSPWHYVRLFVILSLSCCFLVLFLATQSQATATTPTGYRGSSGQRVASPTATTPTGPGIQTQTRQVPLTNNTTSQTQSSQSFNLDPLPNPGEWLWQGLTYVWNQFWKTAVDFFQKQIIDWASTFGFMYVTPADLSYKNPMVLAGSAWALTAMNGLVAILLVFAGYQVMMYRYLDLQEKTLMGTVARILAAAIAANLGFYFILPQLIELCNFLSMSFLGWIMGRAAGDFTLPLGGINWVEQPVVWAIFILIDFIASVCYVFIAMVRLAVLDICIVLAPWWIVLLGNEFTRNWGRLGATTFFSALLVQPLQVIILGLGSALIANFSKVNINAPDVCANMSDQAKQACLDRLGHASVSASATPIAIFLGTAIIYVAFKIPGMLFSEAVSASLGAVNRDVTNTTKSIINSAKTIATITGIVG